MPLSVPRALIASQSASPQPTVFTLALPASTSQTLKPPPHPHTMATNNPTITTLKTTFLRTQINTLSTPLRPSSAFLTNQAQKDEALSQKTIDDALLKLNAILKKHNKVAYGPQATRHVAEQIDRLYWGGERGAMVGGAAVGEEWMGRGGDMSKFCRCIGGDNGRGWRQWKGLG